MLAVVRVCIAGVVMLPLYAATPQTTASGSPEKVPTLAEAHRFEGKTIATIEWEPADQPLTPAELSKRVPFRAGDRFSEQALRRAIQALFASGRYADLAVDAREAPNGAVVLRFETKRAYFVGRVVVAGVKQPPNSGQLAAAAKLHLGAPFVPADRTEAVESMQDLMRQNGFYHSRVDVHISYRADTESANIAFRINPGKRARFTLPEITGHPVFSTDAIVRATRWKRLYGLLGWQEVTEARVRQGLDNIRAYYDKRNLLQSKVTLTRLEYLDQTSTVRPHVDVEAGPKIVVNVEGVRMTRGRLAQLVPIFQEKSVDPDLLVEGQRNLQQYLQAQGYFGAQVTYKIEGGETERERTVTYSVDRGARRKLVRLSFSGNRYFANDTIRERLYTEPASFPRFPAGRFSEIYLRQDINAIENLYRSNGFRDVKVSSRVVDHYRSVADHIAVFLNIEEGPQWFVSALSVEGVSARELEQLHLRLSSVAGQPLSEASIAGDRDTILSYFYGRGFPNAAFEFYETAEEGDRVQLRYVIRPGQREYVRGVIVSGLETTKPKLVDKRIGLAAGEPLSITEETDSQRRLYNLGIFARVNTAIQNPDGDETDRYVLYDIDEARHYSLNVGVGAQIARFGGGVTSLDNPAGTTGFSPRIAVGLSRINFLGLGQTLGIQTAASTIEQRAALTYFIPQFVSHDNLTLTMTGLIENTNDVRTFTAHRREASVQLGQRLSRAYSLQYRLIFRNVTLANLKISSLLVPLLSSPEVLGLGEFSVIQDKRDDPADAHRGMYSTLDLSYAPGYLGSQTQFARGLIRNSTYHPIGRDLVFARSTQFGVISRFGGAPVIPLPERFYSGGSTSLRSFPDFQAGPRDPQTGFPLGGNALLTNSLELRFPLYGDNVGGVLFEDAGNVYTTLSDISFRFRQQNLQDFNYMVQSLGFGLRYRTPIGPVRLDFSFSPDAPRFFGLKGSLQDLINGTAVPTVQKINAFQFHFSLGQAF